MTPPGDAGGEEGVAAGGRTNEDVARMLEAFADAYGALDQRYRRHAYERAAASVRGAGVVLTEHMSEAELRELPNVGESIAEKVHEFLQTGKVAELEALRRDEFPKDFAAFVSLEGVGPKLARRFYTEKGISTLDDLEDAAASGRLVRMPGISDRMRQRILREIPRVREEGVSRRVLLARAWPLAESLAGALRGVPGVERVAVAGSIRRRRSTIKDIDVVASARDPDPVVDAFTHLPMVRDVTSKGDRTHVLLDSGMAADLYVVPPEGWGAALLYFTGSREHTLELRERARARGWSLKNDRLEDAAGNAVPAATEEAVYDALGLAPIPPEMRENMGEVAAAESGDVPRLVEPGDIRGDLHAHTLETDGTATLEEMAEHAARLGHEYLAVTDHGTGLPVPRGLDEEALLARKRRVSEAEGLPLAVLVGVEANILEGGDLGLRDDCLEQLDVVVASVHSQLRQDRARITRRVVDAVSTGLVDVLGHPTNRRLPRRPESDIDFERVFDAAAHHGVALEVNSNPERMDLPGRLVKRGRDMGLTFSVDTDAHHVMELANTEYGVAMARRGWLTREDVLTARGLEGLVEWLQRRRSRELSVRL